MRTHALPNMENETGTVAPQDDNAADELDGLDADALKEKYLSQKTKYEEIETKNRQLFERLKKEQGFERDPDDPTNWIKVTKQAPPVKKSDSKTPEKRQGELDYGLLSFFNDKSEIKVVHDDDVDFLQKELDSTGKPLLELLKNKYFLSELKDRQDERAVKEATPSSTGRSVGSKKDVSYWLTQPYDKVPADMRNAVLDAIKEQGAIAR